MKKWNAIVQRLLKERNVKDGVSILFVYLGIHNMSFFIKKKVWSENLSFKSNKFQEKLESISNFLMLVYHVKILSMEQKYAKKQQVLQKLSS